MIYSSRAAIGYLVTFGDAAWSDRFSALCEASHKADYAQFLIM